MVKPPVQSMAAHTGTLLLVDRKTGALTPLPIIGEDQGNTTVPCNIPPAGDLPTKPPKQTGDE